MTKKDNGIIQGYLNSRYGNLWTAYNKPSSRKAIAWHYCEAKCREYGGENLKVISRNTSKFTAGFTFRMAGKMYLMYITKGCDRAIEMEG